MARKLTKAAVNYRQAKGAPRRCGTCVMFRPKLAGQTGECTLVAGYIRARDVCDRWAPK